jgi:hypothetical protein
MLDKDPTYSGHYWPLSEGKANTTEETYHVYKNVLFGWNI